MAISGDTKSFKKRPRRQRRSRALTRAQASQVTQIAKSVTTEKFEVKNHDISLTSINLEPNTGTPYFLDLTNIVQGVGEHQRVGGKISPLYLGLRGELRNQSSGGHNQVRMMIIQWYSANATPPTVNNLLQTPALPFSFRQTNNASTYKVLWDQKFVMSNSISNPNHEFLIDVSLSKVMKTVEYNDSSSTLGEGHVYLFAISNDTTFSPPQIKDMVIRLKYTDA